MLNVNFKVIAYNYELDRRLNTPFIQIFDAVKGRCTPFECKTYYLPIGIDTQTSYKQTMFSPIETQAFNDILQLSGTQKKVIDKNKPCEFAELTSQSSENKQLLAILYTFLFSLDDELVDISTVSTSEKDLSTKIVDALMRQLTSEDLININHDLPKKFQEISKRLLTLLHALINNEFMRKKNQMKNQSGLLLACRHILNSAKKI